MAHTKFRQSQSSGFGEIGTKQTHTRDTQRPLLLGCKKIEFH